MSARIVSLCAGIGGLELGLERAGLGTVVAQSEIDPHASAVLAEHWPGVPNLGDFRDQPLPPCDVLTAGFPCQPVSSAGRRQGTEDDRWLFDDICTALGRMDPPPRLLVFENVRGLLSANGGGAMARVVEGLAALGFVGRHGLLRASDVGAPHRRERVFIAAWNADGARAHPRPEAGPSRGGAGESGGRATAHAESDPGWLGDGDDIAAPDASGEGGRRVPTGAGPRAAQGVEVDGRPAGEPRRRHRGDRDPSALGDAADADEQGLEGPQPAGRRLVPAGSRAPSHIDWGPYGPAIARWEALTRPAPEPTIDGRLSPRFVEWMMGYEEGWATDCGLTRTAALRCLGNAVVSQVAERWGWMLQRLPASAPAHGEGVAPSPQPSQLLPTPTAMEAGGTPESFMERKRRSVPTASKVTDLGHAITLLPTPTANQPGGTAEAHLARKNRNGGNRSAVTDLGMVIEQQLAPSARTTSP